MPEKIKFKCLYCPQVLEELKRLVAHYNLCHAPEGKYILKQSKGKDEKIAGLGESQDTVT